MVERVITHGCERDEHLPQSLVTPCSPSSSPPASWISDTCMCAQHVARLTGQGFELCSPRGIQLLFSSAFSLHHRAGSVQKILETCSNQVCLPAVTARQMGTSSTPS